MPKLDVVAGVSDNVLDNWSVEDRGLEQGERMPIFGYHDVYETDFLSALKAASEHGFQYVQFDLNVPGLYIDHLPRKRLHEIRSAASDLDVAISLHAPGDTIGLFTDYPAIRRGILDHFERVLEQANELGAHHMTVHPFRPPSFLRADTLRDGFQDIYFSYYRDVLMENLFHLTRVSGRVLITVENSDFIDIAIEALSDMFQRGTDLFLALDWAKLHRTDLAPDDAQLTFFQKHRERIRDLHLHDRDANGRTHLAPGQGSLNFRSLFEKFYEDSQWLTIEVRPFAEAVRARERFLGILGTIGSA
jgi:sugar phosphate isomerase/epimerase